MIIRTTDDIAVIPITGPAGPVLTPFWIMATPRPITKDAIKPIMKTSRSKTNLSVPNQRIRATIIIITLKLKREVKVILFG